MNEHIGRWVLEKLHCYNPYSGVTNNISESLNKVIKDLQHWKEVPVDCMILALYQLQAYYVNEIRRGLAGIGEYTLQTCYSSLHTNIVDYIPSKAPDEIVIGIKESRSLSPDTQQLPEGGMKIEDKNPEDLTRNLSSNARACLLLESGMISFDHRLHVFTVKGISGVPRVVTLFPKQTACSCPSTGECYHILAVQMSVGIEKEQKPSRRNLTQLRKNTRAKADKKSGRK